MTQVIFSIILCKTCIISRHFIVTDTTEIRINLLNKYPKYMDSGADKIRFLH